MNSVSEHAAYQSAVTRVVAGDPEVAVKELIEALKSNPDAGRLWELRGQAHLAMGESIDAVSCLEHATCLIPLSIEGRLALGHAYELTERKSLARDLFVSLANEERLPTGMLEPLARALGRMDEPSLALGLCTEAARRTPDSAAPLLGMVFYQRRMGFPPERILPVLFQAFHLAPEDFDTRLTLARMLNECGQSREAAELLSVVEIETSRCPNCLVAMQQIFEATGDQENVGRCVDALIALAQQ